MIKNIVTTKKLTSIEIMVALYIVLVVGMVIALIVLEEIAPSFATNEAWGHAIIVMIFVVLLPLRLRAARRGSVRALRAVGIISAALVAVNLIEAAIPNFFPVWMRLLMVLISALMLYLAISVARIVRSDTVGL